ncbi:MAG: molybdenum cofactor guanylyltransferase [Solirubrobacteraceae bacterium]
MAERSAAIVLAGGESERMGTAKAQLEWHGSTLLRRAAGLVGRVVDGPVVVVGADGQALPALPAAVEIARDARAGRGPLQGLAAGLAAIGGRAEIVFVTGVDAPLLHPALVAHVLRCLRPEDDVALPRVDGFAQPLAAAYRTSVAAQLSALIDGGQLAAGALTASIRARELDEPALLSDGAVAALDPMLDSLRNLNTPGEYEAARARPAPAVTTRVAGGASHDIQAATLGAAARATGVELRAGVVAKLSGDGSLDDPEDPLAEGDSLIFEAVAGRS